MCLCVRVCISCCECVLCTMNRAKSATIPFWWYLEFLKIFKSLQFLPFYEPIEMGLWNYLLATTKKVNCVLVCRCPRVNERTSNRIYYMLALLVTWIFCIFFHIFASPKKFTLIIIMMTSRLQHSNNKMRQR